VDPSIVAIVAEGFLSRLSFGLISFALPLYALSLGLGLTEIGFLLSLNLVVAITLKPLGGFIADRWGLKRTLTASIGLRSVVSLLFALARVPWQIYSIRSIHGVSISLRDPAVNTLIAERGGKKAIASSFAWYQTAKSLAGSIGRAIAGVLLTLTASNFSMIFFISFVLSALPLFIVLRYVRDTAPAQQPAAEAEAEVVAAAYADGREQRDRGPQPKPSTASFAGLGFLVTATAYMLSSLFPIFATEYVGLTEAETGMIYLVSSLVVISGPVFGWLSDNVSQRLVLLTRSVANVFSSLLYIVWPSFAGLAVGRTVDEVGKAAFRPAWGALMAQATGHNKRGRARAMGFMSAGEDAGEVAGPILAGFLWSTWGIAVVLVARMMLAVVAEVYTVRLTRTLEASRPPALSRNALWKFPPPEPPAVRDGA
jgi:MFS family permease